MQEPWFKALSKEQSRQDEIDRYEGYSLPFNSAADIYGLQAAPELLTKRDVGRPSTDWRLIEQVLRIYDESVEAVREGRLQRPKSLRAIARELGNKLGYVTVRNILLEYRSEKTPKASE